VKKPLVLLSAFLLINFANVAEIAAAEDPLALSAINPKVGPVGGQPAEGSKQSVKDLDYQVKYQRAFESVIWATPALDIYNFIKANNAVGAQSNDIVAFSKPGTQVLEALTANNQVPYTTGYSDLSAEPAVLVVPAASDVASFFGQVVGTWQTTVADVGPPGLDKGKGGKYLLLPPGYKSQFQKAITSFIPAPISYILHSVHCLGPRVIWPKLHSTSETGSNCIPCRKPPIRPSKNSSIHRHSR
jgi:hypothetical protein